MYVIYTGDTDTIIMPSEKENELVRKYTDEGYNLVEDYDREVGDNMEGNIISFRAVVR